MKVAGKKFGSIRVFPICPTLELMDQMLVANLLESISIVNDCKKKMSNKSWSKHIRYKNMQQSGLFIFFFFLIIDILVHKQATCYTSLQCYETECKFFDLCEILWSVYNYPLFSCFLKQTILVHQNDSYFTLTFCTKRN